jgi:hypothetical protein
MHAFVKQENCLWEKNQFHKKCDCEERSRKSNLFVNIENTGFQNTGLPLGRELQAERLPPDWIGVRNDLY